ncbi:cytochrome c oxidase polypeptide vib [Colletotrichum truncatum]|uniref:Cytochrome c oxidase polypeptide vib n=1 Tax=Colletotrichum truncatum TaxID=5467 RepID=A0ACC3ZA53_COLTU
MADDQELVTKPFNRYEPSARRSGTWDATASIDVKHHEQWLNVNTGTDARFPNMNQTKHCWQNYVDYHKCINAKGEDFAPCRQFWLGYRSLCPSGWYQRWDEQREAGNFPVNLNA